MLRQRIITALLLVAALGGLLFAAPLIVTLTAFSVVVGLAGWEWGGLLGFSARNRVIYGVAMTALCLSCISLRAELTLPGLVMAACAWLLMIPFWLRQRWVLKTRPLAGAVCGIALLLPLWLAVAELQARGPWWLLGAMAIVWVADIAAYFAGVNFGRHKLAPAISPGKTWEGVAGALIGVSIYCLSVIYLSAEVTLQSLSWWLLLPLMVMLTAVSVMGDLFESLLKRQVGIKDSSQMLPGHGGLLDRIDALISTVPLVALLLRWVAP